MDFARAYEQHFHATYKYLFYMVGNNEVAEDLTQETFLKVLKGQFRGEAQIGTYIRQIARHVVYDYFRRQALIKWLPFINDSRHATDYVPHEWLAQSEERHALFEALQKLKKEHREVIIYRKIEERSIEETAQLLGWNYTKVANTQRTAMKALEKYLGGEDYARQATKGTE